MEGVSKTTIAHEIGGINDSLRFGLQGVRSEIVGVHPLQAAIKSSKMTEAEMKRKFLETTYGSAFPLKMDLDSRMLSRFQRPPGALPSSMLGYEAVTGSLDDFGFEDFHCINGKGLLMEFMSTLLRLGIIVLLLEFQLEDDGTILLKDATVSSA